VQAGGRDHLVVLLDRLEERLALLLLLALGTDHQEVEDQEDHREQREHLHEATRRGGGILGGLRGGGEDQGDGRGHEHLRIRGS
jgi:hypothetical protein